MKSRKTIKPVSGDFSDQTVPMMVFMGFPGMKQDGGPVQRVQISMPGHEP